MRCLWKRMMFSVPIAAKPSKSISNPWKIRRRLSKIAAFAADPFNTTSLAVRKEAKSSFPAPNNVQAHQFGREIAGFVGFRVLILRTAKSPLPDPMLCRYPAGS